MIIKIILYAEYQIYLDKSYFYRNFSNKLNYKNMIKRKIIWR